MTKFKAASVFSDNMVLQRDKNINVFGYGTDGDTVAVNFCGNTETTVIKDGKWLCILPPHSAGEGYEMTVSCKEYSRTFRNVAVGEVWLAGGQSNMELELQNCAGGADYLKNDKNPNVRFYYTQKYMISEPDFFEKEECMGWNLFDENSAKAWSAVGYFFAKDLAERLGVIVGVIGCNWGGTSASHWMSRKAIIQDEDTRIYIDEYDKAVEGKTEQQLFEEYEEYVKYDREWNERSAKYYSETENPSWGECLEVCGECRYPGPLCPRNPFHPTGLYESMLMRVCPYTIKGFIYYQGESDDHRPKTYYKLFNNLIKNWREEWKDDELAFLTVQLPMHRYKDDSDRKSWCYIREAQMRTYKTVKNTGIAVIIDCGEFNEIHPKNKVPVGNRLCLQAMYNIYGDKSVSAFGPIYKSSIADGNKINIAFDYADNGFEIKGDLSGFEIAGDDKAFVTANAEINADNTISVFAEGIEKPMYVRYLWTNYGEVTLFGKNKLPVAPFRTSTDDE